MRTLSGPCSPYGTSHAETSTSWYNLYGNVCALLMWAWYGVIPVKIFNAKIICHMKVHNTKISRSIRTVALMTIVSQRDANYSIAKKKKNPSYIQAQGFCCCCWNFYFNRKMPQGVSIKGVYLSLFCPLLESNILFSLKCKCSSILHCTCSPQDKFTIAIGDFDSIKPFSSWPLRQVSGTPYYRPPEVSLRYPVLQTTRGTKRLEWSQSATSMSYVCSEISWTMGASAISD